MPDNKSPLEFPTIRKIETELHDQGVKLFPSTRTGDRARDLWHRIRPALLRGKAIEITCLSLRLDLHREELKRAKMVLEEMGLIQRRAGGRYVLGDVGPCGAIDELIRNEFLNLKVLESLVILLASIGKQKPIKNDRASGRRKKIPRA
jgi:hypothetical protein